MGQRERIALVIAGVHLGLGCAAWGSSISVYVAAPQVASSQASGGTAVNETFNSISTGAKTASITRPIGTVILSSTTVLRIQNSDQFGGAGNAGRYAAFGAQTGTSGAITLNLASPTSFFGMWWPAIDSFNGVSLYSGNTRLMRFSATDLTSVLGAASTIASVGGTIYSTADYLGKPGTGPPRQNMGEYYAYTMFQASGLTFDRLVFDNSGTTSTGFEMDNWQTRSGNFTIPNTSVLISNIQVAPEPDFWIPAAGGLTAALLWRRRRKAPGAAGGRQRRG